MGSPFPGMDPYIEAAGLWEDFHQSLISAIKRALAPSLPERYVVRGGERTYLVLSTEGGETEFLAQPDVGLARLAREGSTRRAETGPASAVLETPAEAPGPVTVRAYLEAEQREPFLEIYELHAERKLVTCIEVLSPSNKRPGTPGWQQYTRKRQAFLGGAAHFIEIDLLRGGRRMPMADELPASPYYLLLCRKEEAPRCKVWAADYRKPLPPIPVPLSVPDPDVTLALQPLVEAVYAESCYDRDIDYGRPLTPPLDMPGA